MSINFTYYLQQGKTIAKDKHIILEIARALHYNKQLKEPLTPHQKFLVGKGTEKGIDIREDKKNVVAVPVSIYTDGMVYVNHTNNIGNILRLKEIIP